MDPDRVPDVSRDERLARYILVSSHVRTSDGTVRPDAFMPHPRIELSMNRHRESTDDELWQVGCDVARQRSKTLYGRADVEVVTIEFCGLSIVPKTLPANPNHADAIGWPSEKSEQKLLAIRIASVSRFIPTPSNASV